MGLTGSLAPTHSFQKRGEVSPNMSKGPRGTTSMPFLLHFSAPRPLRPSLARGALARGGPPSQLWAKSCPDLMKLTQRPRKPAPVQWGFASVAEMEMTPGC